MRRECLRLLEVFGAQSRQGSPVDSLRTTTLLQKGAEHGLTLHQIGPPLSKTHGFDFRGLIMYREDRSSEDETPVQPRRGPSRCLFTVGRGILERMISRCWETCLLSTYCFCKAWIPRWPLWAMRPGQCPQRWRVWIFCRSEPARHFARLSDMRKAFVCIRCEVGRRRAITRALHILLFRRLDFTGARKEQVAITIPRLEAAGMPEERHGASATAGRP